MSLTSNRKLRPSRYRKPTPTNSSMGVSWGGDERVRGSEERVGGWGEERKGVGDGQGKGGEERV